MESYRLLAKDYDELNPRREIYRQRAFFRTLVREHAVRDALDCACGTGWHLALLQDLGVRVFGSDLSRSMLSQARRNLRGRRIPLKRADYRGLRRAWSRRFGMIACLTNSLPHMRSKRDVVAALRSMRDRLAPGGILVISNGICDSLLDRRPALVAGRVRRRHAFYFFLEYPNRERIVFHVLHVKKTASGFAHGYERIEYNAMRRATLARCLARAGFARIRYYGNHDFSPYTRRSPRLIVVAEK